jgi:hypothetical protein
MAVTVLTLLKLLYQFYSVLKNREHHDEINLTVFKQKYCSFNLVVGRKILLDIMSD